MGRFCPLSQRSHQNITSEPVMLQMEQVETLPDGMYSSNFVMGFVKVVYRNGVCTVHITWDVKSVRTVNAVF